MSSDSPRKPEAQYLPQHGQKLETSPAICFRLSLKSQPSRNSQVGLGIRLSPHRPDETTEGTSSQPCFIGTITKGLVDSSKNAVKAVQVASFPFDDHNCPPIHLITSFCQSAYSWLKEDIENVGMARTGLMICNLLLYLKFFPTAEECMDFYNQKRCVVGKGLVLLLPSQIRYVKYFERILTYFNGENQTGRKCMLREFRFHTYWIRPSITISDHNGVLFATEKHPRTLLIALKFLCLRLCEFALSGLVKH